MINKMTLVGYLGRDPEMRYTPSGIAVTNMSIATTKKWTQDGQPQERTTWFSVAVWRNQAEACATYLSKGSLVYVEGEMLQPEVYTDRNGNARASLKINARQVKFLTTPREAEEPYQAEPVQQQQTQTQNAAQATPDTGPNVGWDNTVPEDSIPF